MREPLCFLGSLFMPHCSATTKAGVDCKAYAIRGSELCSAHSRKVGAPPGNKNRETHGFYAESERPETIDDVVKDLFQRQRQLAGYIDEQMEAGDIEADTVVKLWALSAQNASRLGRLLRDQRALSGGSLDGLLEVIGLLYDEINEEGSLAVVL